MTPVPAPSFSHLLAPGRIGGLALPNRIVMSAMDMNLCHDGVLDDADVAHFAAHARGGAALVTTGASAVAYPEGATSRRQPGLSDDRFLPGLRALADGVHAAGGRVCVQLCHHGKIAAIDSADGRPMLVPSIPRGKLDYRALVDTTSDERAGLASAREGKGDRFHEATEDDLARVIDQFADAAARVQRAGIDAVEVHAGHGYLLCAFLSAGYNHRTDRWGGSLDNRARLTCEVIRAVRGRVGADYPIIVKFDGRQFLLDGGLDVGESAAAARLFEAAGADAIHVSGYADNPFSGFTLGPLPSAIAAYRDVTRAVKQAVGIPVMAVGRMLPEVAEEMLAAGECDFVAMGRQLLADADLPAKIHDGRRASVRPCINCYVCVEQNFFDATPKCAVNPALNHVVVLDPDEVTTARRHVVVVGGGPGGMEVARLAARRGHRVTLLERARRLGGTLWFSQLTTPANGPLLDWLEHELAAEHVDVRTATEASPALLTSLQPDVVVVATGARRDRPDVPGADLPHVHTGDDLRRLLAGEGAHGARGRVTAVAGRLGLLGRADRIRRWSKWWMPVAKDVVVVGGGLVGLELAEFLAERGRRVTVLEDGPVLGLPMAMPRRFAAVAAATAHGVELVRGAEVVEIRPDAVVYRAGDDTRTASAGTVIVAAGVRPDTSVADGLRAAGFDVRVVGDAGDVGYLEGAIHSAWRVVAGLS